MNNVCNIEYDNELNNRLNTRYFPSQELQPNLSFRPEPTKYSHFKITNNIPNNNYNMKYKPYSTHKVFNPGNAKAPVHYALDNVDVESRLRNQFFALQKNDNAFYIPDIYSDLYINNYNDAPKNKNYLYETVNNQKNNNNINDKCSLAPNTFNNSTRYNLKNLK